VFRGGGWFWGGLALLVLRSVGFVCRAKPNVPMALAKKNFLYGVLFYFFLFRGRVGWLGVCLLFGVVLPLPLTVAIRNVGHFKAPVCQVTEPFINCYIVQF